MKAIRYHEFGGVDVLRYEDVPDPEIGDNEVLVKVKASSLNQLDLRLRSGKSPRPVDLPHIGGVDISGEVEQFGKGVKGMKKGEHVLIDPTVKTDGPPKVVGVNLQGGFAEYVKVPSKNIVPIPESLSFNDASTLPICYVTAWYAFFERGNLKSGNTVLIHAAGSGTGVAAIQIAKQFGVKIIATAGTDEKLSKARELGADETINYNSMDFEEEVKRLTQKRGVDLIFDQIGASVWEKNMQCLAPRGGILLVGVVGGGVTSFNIGQAIVKDISIMGVTVFNAPRRNLESVITLAAEGKIKPVIDRAFPLSEAAKAQKLLEDRTQFGKVILNP